ncbi:MAG: ABC transporter ATP-binding protein [Bacillota bacterium]
MGSPAGVMAEVQDVEKIYGTGDAAVAALRGVSLSAREGEFLAITGPSGSGKSTLLNLIGALDRPTGGTVKVGGVDLSTLRGNALADFRFRFVGFVFQQFYLLPNLTALENVMVPLLSRRVDFDRRSRALEALAAVGMERRARALPAQMSGGEQQRVAVARALVNRPRLILADEPTGNLDSVSGVAVIRLLEEARARDGATVILVTHNLELASRADRQVHLVDGLVVRESVSRGPYLPRSQRDSGERGDAHCCP